MTELEMEIQIKLKRKGKSGAIAMAMITSENEDIFDREPLMKQLIKVYDAVLERHRVEKKNDKRNCN